MNIEDPNELVIETATLLNKGKIPYALYGGLALAVYGVPRETRDVDHFLTKEYLALAKESILKKFPSSQVSLENDSFGGLYLTRMTVFQSAKKKSGEVSLNTIDLVSPMDDGYAQRALMRSVEGPLRGKKIKIVSPEDFIIFKILSTREKDIEDAVNVLKELKKKIDYQLIEKEIAILEKSIPNHNIKDRWNKVKREATS